jgi:hypothetical protein
VHTRVADPDAVEQTTDEALGLIDDLYPDEWKDAGDTADFDVISGTLDRLEAAANADQYARAEQARLEAYAVFEFGPEQRLRGLASGPSSGSRGSSGTEQTACPAWRSSSSASPARTRSQRRAGRSTRRSPMRSAQSERARPPPRPWSRTRR